jgi:hypothetical protein
LQNAPGRAPASEASARHGAAQARFLYQNCVRIRCSDVIALALSEKQIPQIIENGGNQERGSSH